MEEELFYPAVREQMSGEAAHPRHREVKDLLADLAKIEPQKQGYNEVARAHANVPQHVEEEKSETLPADASAPARIASSSFLSSSMTASTSSARMANAGDLKAGAVQPLGPALTLGFLGRCSGSPRLPSYASKGGNGMKRLWRNYSLSITLGLLFFLSWFAQLVTQWFNWANEQQEHNQPLEVGDFLWQFWTSTLENWQSEFLQLFTFVVLTSFLIHRNSPESRDSDDEMQQSLNRIEKRLKSLEEAGEGGKSKAGSR